MKRFNLPRALILSLLLACLLAASAQADPIVGFWKWADGQEVMIRPDGVFSLDYKIQGKWTALGQARYRLVNEEGYTDELTLAGDILSGKGWRSSRPAKTWPMRCTRMNSDPIVGFWKWADGQTAAIRPDGVFFLDYKIQGKWTALGQARYRLVNEEGYTDELTLAGDMLSGKGWRSSRPAKTWPMRCTRMK